MHSDGVCMHDVVAIASQLAIAISHMLHILGHKYHPYMINLYHLQ